MIELNQDIKTLVRQLRNGELRTPEKIDEDVFAFCQHVQSSEMPIYLNIKPFHWSRVNCCDLNVQKAVNENGGYKVFGFRIWSLPTMYIEADLHCIWQNSTGELIDITPNEDGEERILFLPDSRLESVRLVIKGDKPRLALRDSLIDFVNMVIEKESEIGNAYPSDEELWNNNISYKRLKKKIRKRK